MSKQKILIVDDEEDILELLRFTLTREGFDVRCAATGEEALEMARSEPPELILLDLMLPGMDGLQVTRRLKEGGPTRTIPIVMLTARGEEADIVTGLEIGADDYVTKPFSKKVLLARLRTILRRQGRGLPDEEAPLTMGELVIHPGKHEVLVKGRPVQLTFTEFGIILYLARKPGWVFTRSQIVDAVRGDDYFVTDRAVDVQMVGLRKKLGPAARHIETIRGVGYRFKE